MSMSKACEAFGYLNDILHDISNYSLAPVFALVAHNGSQVLDGVRFSRARDDTIETHNQLTIRRCSRALSPSISDQC